MNCSYIYSLLCFQFSCEFFVWTVDRGVPEICKMGGHQFFTPQFLWNRSLVGQFNQHVYTQIPKAQKDIDNFTEFLHFWDLRAKKLCLNRLVTLTLGVNFINVLSTSFTSADPKRSAKKTVKSSVSFWVLLMQKLLVKCWWNQTHVEQIGSQYIAQTNKEREKKKFCIDVKENDIRNVTYQNFKKKLWINLLLPKEKKEQPGHIICKSQLWNGHIEKIARSKINTYCQVNFHLLITFQFALKLSSVKHWRLRHKRNLDSILSQFNILKSKIKSFKLNQMRTLFNLYTNWYKVVSGIFLGGLLKFSSFIPYI